MTHLNQSVAGEDFDGLLIKVHSLTGICVCPFISRWSPRTYRKILLSCRDGMVFIQTDKPVYTPRQSGKNSTPYQDPFKVFSCLEQLVGPMGVHCNLKYTYGHLLSRENTQFPNQRKNKGIVQYQCLIIIFIILYHFRFKQDKNALKVE